LRAGRDENPPLLEKFNETYKVHLEKFDGPLDLLLHLIRKNELDIFDIPIAVITGQYLEYVNLMRELNLEVAGDFLLMATTLLHIKSSGLLPGEEPEYPDDEEDDPKEELVRRLLEYQRYRDAAHLIGSRALMGREVFAAGSDESALLAEEREDAPIEVGLFELVEAFRNLLKRTPQENFHHVAPPDSFSVVECMNEILEMLQNSQIVRFEEILKDDATREKIIATFLALLELGRLKLVRIFQDSPDAVITLSRALPSEFVTQLEPEFPTQI